MTEPALEYTLPGVLYYLQAEWRKFEREKNEWTIERAELKARIALLEGERRGIENSKLILMKRVKMLEYALRQERKMYTKDEPSINEENIHKTAPSDILPQDDHSNKLREKSKELLTSCIEEINYLTSIPTKLPLTHALSTDHVSLSRVSSAKRAPISNRNQKPAVQRQPTSKRAPSAPKEDIPTPENVDEVAMMSNNKLPDNKEISAEIQEKFHISEDKVLKLMKNANKGTKENSLAGDIDSNQIREATDSRSQKSQQKVWKNRTTIKGHLDSVRTVCFHPTEMMAASGSDDGTVKIWNLKRTASKDGKKGNFEEADPSITFRGHTNIVTTVMISSEQNRVYSSSLDSTIRVWKLPPEDCGPFSPVDPSLNLATYVGHTDAIWDLKLSSFSNILASASSDGTVKIWDTQSTGSLLKSSWTFDGSSNESSSQQRVPPTSLDFCQFDSNKLVVSFSNAKIRIFDIETGRPITTLKGSDETYDNTTATQINRIVTHPTLPLIISAHEDHHIKVFDIKSGECIQTLSGHLDAVTSLDVDPMGNTLVSGGHDSSIRTWNLNTFTNEQEFSAHRRKGHESVLSVRLHRSYPWMLSGGADGIIKIYHYG
ncbi:WD40-repeat-containing domain protein [Sporodiniella umbellata]|nr:WD40-repeat-containing domain protein [Sporodiniella umbellata]